jgi:hypothetical protein
MMLALVQLSKPALRRWSWIALLLLQVAVFARFLAGFRYLPGADAYYYALQARSLLDTGHLKVPDGDLVHYLVAAAADCGLSIELAFKIVLTAIYAAYSLGLLLLLLRLKEKVQPLAALLWVLSCGVIAFHVIEFPKLSLGLAMVPFWLWLILIPRSIPRASTRRLLSLTLLLIAACFIHPVMAALAVIFSCAVIFEYASGSEALRVPQKILLAAFTGSAFFAAILAVRLFALGPRLASLLRPGPPAILGLAGSPDIPFEMKLVIFGFWILLGLCLLIYLGNKSFKKQFVILSLASLVLPLWPDHVAGFQDLGARLAAMFIFLALPLVVILANEFARHKLFVRLRPRWLQRTAVVLTTIALAILPLRLDGYHDALITDDYAQYEKVVSALSRREIPILIAHRGLDFFYSYRLRRDAFHFDPEADWNRLEIWRVAARITPDEVAYYSPPSCPWGESGQSIPGTDFLLIREDCWEQMRAAIKDSDNPDLYIEVWRDPENPSQPRPEFLRVRHGDPAGK